MHRNNQNNKSADRLLKMPGKMDRGPVNFEARIAHQDGEIMAIASKEVISVAPTTTIMGDRKNHDRMRLPPAPYHRCRNP
jgi:hypothetical protein